MKHIDPHCHCRNNIRRWTKLAKTQGVIAVFDMPNTDPPILRERDVIKRLKLAESKDPVVQYFLYVGLTSRFGQIEEAVELVKKYPQVVGLKLYCSGLGRLGVSRETGQERIYKFLARLNYQGFLAVHCEKESKFQPELWDPTKPWTHSLAQPPEAEIESVKDQIRFARMSHFPGHLHICHISCAEAVDLVWQAKKYLRITSGVTPPHLLWSFEDLKTRGAIGLLLKVNPPLRSRATVQKLREYLKQDKIDWVETDHAPHSLLSKLFPPYRSGIPSLYFYQEFLKWLGQQGVNQETIENLTYWNIKRVFGDKLKRLTPSVNRFYNAR